MRLAEATRHDRKLILLLKRFSNEVYGDSRMERNVDDALRYTICTHQDFAPIY